MKDEDRLAVIRIALREHLRQVVDLHTTMVWELSARLDISEDRVRELIDEAMKIETPEEGP